MPRANVRERYYEPIPGETHKAWLAFCTYRDMGGARSLDKACRQMTGKTGRHARHWATWSKKNHWVTRSQAYDRAAERRQRKRVEEEREARYAEIYARIGR